jgi:hypothetical protein
MTKIPKSITVTVRNGDNFRATRPGRIWLGDGASVAYLREYIRPVPKPPYRVTYTVVANGTYEVVSDAGDAGIRKDNWFNEWGNQKRMSVCFLPREWIGLRVSRKVTPIRATK